MNGYPGLYRPSFEHDACGIGFVASITGHKSHAHIQDALTLLENMEHRGACGCESNTGDGAGILIQVPHEFFFDALLRQGVHLPPFGRYGVGVLFFPPDLRTREACRESFLRCAERIGLQVIGWRSVPVQREGIGDTALSAEPEMEQVFIAAPDGMNDSDALERKLFLLRRHAEHTVRQTVRQGPVPFYIASLSCRTVVYKGQLTSGQVRTYFPDLSNRRVVSAFGLVHSRFATNTFPSWGLAQPFRYLAHNGEINTLQGNLNWLRSSEKGFTTPYFTAEEMELLLPLISEGQSDSASLDNIVELLTLCGRPLPQVMMMLIPEAWDGHPSMDPEKRAFYEFHATIMEPWDGPAALAFTDGRTIGATLDRNGLRPARYCITTDDRVILASESGALPVPPSAIRERGRLQPGRMFLVDLEAGTVRSDAEIKKDICSRQPYGDWLNRYKIRLEELPPPRVLFTELEAESVYKYQHAFGYTTEELQTVITPMCLEGKEPIGSMGADIPLAVLSNEPQHLSSYFRQLFAQVTNPPIDPIRERLVMSLATFVGNNGNLLAEDPLSCHTVALQHPVLTNSELEKLRSIDTGIYQAKTLQCYFKADGRPGALRKALDRLCRYALDAVEDGFEVLILSDRAIDSDHAPIPSLLAVSAVHHHLIRRGCRGQVGLVVEAGDVWEVHHFATLLGFGATAINPYLALSSIRDLHLKGKLPGGGLPEELNARYIKAVNDGLLKVFSKMGISTLQSYQGAQIFEILGLNETVVAPYFTGAVSRIGGLGLDEIAAEALRRHRLAFSPHALPVERLPEGGIYQWKRKGEAHLFNPQSVHLLQWSTRMKDYPAFKKYCKSINDQNARACTLRSLLEFRYNRPAVPLEEVEPATSIYRRFATGAMSFGSISYEAHAALAIAMNRLGGKSNTGEGGEDERRYAPLPGGDSARSAIKQVASARFGVTSHYLAMADELQIKMAQGAKPGEGGQLPGHKVDEWIGRVRHATPGVGLISPPPHHDIYSIEDLSQLIFDLKNSNPSARISVKLVSKAGVGTIAAGVTKAKADAVLIAGADGGTGASPLSSIRHAGLPWELGLAETHQTLMRNGLRSRVTVQTDGQLRTGRDLVIAALLGAEEWGVATAALVVEGCILMRKCHLNTCPVGIATQDPQLRARFSGSPDHIVTFFQYLTEDLRELMAELGFRTVDEMIGRTDALMPKDCSNHPKQRMVDLSPLLHQEGPPTYAPRFRSELQDHGLEGILDHRLLEAAASALQKGQPVEGQFTISNTDRTTGTMLSHAVSLRYGSAGLPDGTIRFHFRGTAGQSFGAFAARGIALSLEGDGNDYVGKGLSGARLSVYPPPDAGYRAEENIIIGNVALYGATSGQAFIRGMAGERFAVRNSGASAVVEGLGDHGCEYMTGGTVIVLGSTGRNFAAGMSGGLAFVWDVQGGFSSRCNRETVDLEGMTPQDEALVRGLLEQHRKLTASPVALFLLQDWENQAPRIVKVFPKEYKRVLLGTPAPVHA